MTRAAIYARVSTDEQAERQTIENQLAACPAYCERQGHEVFAEYLDEGVSGTVPFIERPAGAQLIAAAEASELDLAITYRLDRYGRDALVCCSSKRSNCHMNSRRGRSWPGSTVVTFCRRLKAASHSSSHAISVAEIRSTWTAARCSCDGTSSETAEINASLALASGLA